MKTCHSTNIFGQHLLLIPTVRMFLGDFNALVMMNYVFGERWTV